MLSMWVNLVLLVAGFVSSVLLFRALGPQGRGETAALQAWPLLLGTFGGLGVQSGTAYFAARNPSRATAAFATALAVLPGICLAVMAAAYFALPHLLSAQRAEIVGAARWFLLMVPVQIIGMLPWPILHALGKMREWNLLRLQFPVFWVGALVIGWTFLTLTPLLVSEIYLGVLLLNAVLWNLVLLRTIKGSFTPDFSLLKPVFRIGVPTLLTGLPQHLNLRLDQLAMAAYLKPAILGYYVTAVAWSSLTTPILTALSLNIFPQLMSSGDARVQIEVLSRTLRLSVLVGSALCIVLMLATPAGYSLIYGNVNRSAIIAAEILIAGGLVTNLNMSLHEAFRAFGTPRFSMYAEFTGLLLTVGLLWLLLPRYGLIGAAVASIVSYVGVLSTLMIFLRTTRGVRPGTCFIPTSSDRLVLRGLISDWNRRAFSRSL